MYLPQELYNKQEEIVKDILKKFYIEEISIKKIEGLSFGNRCYGFIINRENESPLFLKIKPCQEIDSSYIQELGEYLSKDGITPANYRNINNHFIQRIDAPQELQNMEASVQEAILNLENSNINIGNMGEVLGKFHKKSNCNLPLKIKNGLPSSDKNELSNINELQNKYEGLPTSIKSTLEKYKIVQTLEKINSEGLSTIQKGVCHNDPNHQNFISNCGGITKLIDLDEVVKDGFIAKDLGWLAIHTTINPQKSTIDIKQTKHLLMGYYSSFHLPNKDLDLALNLCSLTFLNLAINAIQNSKEKPIANEKSERFLNFFSNINAIADKYSFIKILETAKAQDVIGINYDEKLSDFPIGTHQLKKQSPREIGRLM